MTWMIGIHGLRQRYLWKDLPLIPLWDAVAFGIWIASFTRSSIRWRGADYYIRRGCLVPVIPETEALPARSASHATPAFSRQPVRSDLAGLRDR
jgi:hypothetical protein